MKTNFKITTFLFLVILILDCDIKEDLNDIIGQAPNAFSLTSVSNGTTDVDLTPTLSWIAATDDDGDLVAYDLYLDNQQDPTTLLVQGIRTTSYQIQNRLGRGQKYYWKVVAKDGRGNSTRSNETFSFTTLNTGYQYSLITSNAAFSARSLHTMASFDNKLWVIGGWINNGAQAENDVWHSIDGSNWLQATSNTTFRERYGHTSVVFNNKLWVLGGLVLGNGLGSGIQSDVWNTSDGINWSLVTDFGPSAFGHASVVFDNKIWVTGGGGLGSDRVYYSSNGVSWSAFFNPGFSSRSFHSLTVFDNKLWLIGGLQAQGQITKRDIWYSTDGSNWTQVTGNAPFGERYGHTSASYDNKLWVIGGYDGVGVYKNDIWYSTDGSNWVQATPNAPALGARFSQAHTIFDNKLWVSGGNYSGAFKNDVWTME